MILKSLQVDPGVKQSVQRLQLWVREPRVVLEQVRVHDKSNLKSKLPAKEVVKNIIQCVPSLFLHFELYIFYTLCTRIQIKLHGIVDTSI